MLKEINKFRAEIGLRPIVRKKVNCLVCKREFESKDYPRQRLCKKCRSDTEALVFHEVDSIEAS